MDKRKWSPSSVPSRRPPVSILFVVFCRDFALKEATKSDGILIFFCGWLQSPPGQPQGGSLCCLLGLGGRAGVAGVAEEADGTEEAGRTEEAEGSLRLGLKEA